MKTFKKRIILRSATLLLVILMIVPIFSEKKRSNASKQLILDDEVSMVTYNIGDCTFGQMNFSIPYSNVESNLNGILDLLEEGDYDICLLQESDWLNMMNYFINPSKKIANRFSDCSFIYGANSNILNYVDNGNMTLTKYESSNQILIVPIHGDGIINDYFYVHKLLIETRIKIQNSNNELVIYNIHLAPYYRNSQVKLEHIKYILELAKFEYECGNYIIIGGDWNTVLKSIENPEVIIKPQLNEVFEDQLWDFEIINGASHQAVDKDGKITTKTIDGFLFSPNIIGRINALENFEYSDHSPIELKLEFK